MKTLITLFLIFTLSTSTSNITTDYEDGWSEGFCEGFKDVKGQFSVCPVAPVAPIPTTECSSGYKCGYNRGFKAGRKKANQ